MFGVVHTYRSDTTMSVGNVSGFTGSYYNDGEILALKKVSSTGFETEYVLVQSVQETFLIVIQILVVIYM